MEKFFEWLRSFLARFLPKGIMRIAEPFLSVQFFTFLVIGVINTLSTTVIATILDFITGAVFSPDMILLLERYSVTFIIGYVLSLVVSFLLNSHFTFREKPTLKKFIKFPVSYIPNFVIQYLLVWIFTALNWNRTLAYLIAAVCALPITFLVMKLFVFKKKNEK